MCVCGGEVGERGAEGRGEGGGTLGVMFHLAITLHNYKVEEEKSSLSIDFPLYTIVKFLGKCMIKIPTDISTQSVRFHLIIKDRISSIYTHISCFTMSVREFISFQISARSWEVFSEAL